MRQPYTDLSSNPDLDPSIEENYDGLPILRLLPLHGYRSRADQHLRRGLRTVKVDNTADIYDNLNVMQMMMDTIDPEDNEVHQLKDRVIEAAMQMWRIGENILMMALVGETYLTDEEEQIIVNFTNWAAEITDALESH